MGRQLLAIIYASIVFLAPLAAFAGLVACNSPDECGTCEFVATLKNVINFLIKIASIIATIVLVYVGFILAASGGSTAAKQKAKHALTSILIGLVLIIAGYAIVDVVLRVLLPADSPVFQGGRWDTIVCVRPTPAGSLPTSASSTRSATTTFTGPVSDVGACKVERLEPIFGDLSSAASCIIKEESACGGLLDSTVDVTPYKQPISIGVMQINLSANELVGCRGSYNPSGETLNCPKAFSGQYTAKNKNVTITDVQLYERCVAAAKDFECNVKNGKRIYDNAGSWRPWGAAPKCGL